MKNKNALIIIAKHPEIKNVKTRLKSSLSDDKRLKLYKRLLEHTVQRLGSIKGVETFIACAPQSAEHYFSRFGLRLIPLPEGDLGQRMFYAFEEVFKGGYKKAALVGVDIPALTDSIILKAFELLSDNNIVYGPAQDGGYYLVGMSTLIKEIFEEVPWSSEYTLQKSLERARQCGFTVAFTEILSDIDTIEDVRRAGFFM